jgi:transcriptional regulator with XRE-family HTH domain
MQRGNDTPFQSLGEQLRRVRQKASESLAEASGAVEIDLDTLEKFERGENRPTEDILLLLINHFDLGDHEADKLWQLAGYDKKKGAPVDDSNNTSQVMLLPMDARIVYTDMVNITVNNYGVVMNFLQQGAGGSTQPMAVARVGMSLEHAYAVMQVLQQSLDQAGKLQSNKFLPAPQNHDDQSKQ